MKNRKNALKGVAIILVVALISVAAWWITSRNSEVADTPVGDPTPSLSPISDGGGAPSASAKPWSPTVEASWKAGEPNQVAEGIRQIVMDGSLSPQDAAARVADSTSTNFNWSISTSDLTAFRGIKITKVSNAETSGDSATVVFSGESATGETGTLFTVTLARQAVLDDDEAGGDAVNTDAYYATHLDLGDLMKDTPGPMPLSKKAEKDALATGTEGVNFLVDPATYTLTPEQKNEALGRYFLSPQSASQIGPVTSGGREMTTSKTASTTWITNRGEAPTALFSGPWFDPLNSNASGGWGYVVTFARNADGKIAPADAMDSSAIPSSEGE